MEVPQSILHIDSHSNEMSNSNSSKNIRSQFRTKVVVTDDCINVEGEGTPNVVGLFKGSSENTSSMNRYDCDLADLPVIILQQVSFKGNWLHNPRLKFSKMLNYMQCSNVPFFFLISKSLPFFHF